MKTCTRCGQEKVDDRFRQERRQCRECERVQNRAWRLANIDRARAYDATYNATHKSERHKRNVTYYAKHADAMRERSRVYGAEHTEERNAYARRWYHENTERWKERNKAWLAANPDKAEHIRKKTNERRSRWDTENPNKARDKNAWRRAKTCQAATVEKVRRVTIWQRDGGRCHICGKLCNPAKWHLDHLVPLSIGGTHEPSNVAVSHPRCNIARGNHGPAQLRLTGEV